MDKIPRPFENDNEKPSARAVSSGTGTSTGTSGRSSLDSDSRILNKDVLFEKIEYGEENPNDTRLNLRTRVLRQYDSAGIITRMGKNPITDEDEAYDYKGNLFRLKLELIRFIDRLKPHQKFFVIFFDEEVHPMPSNGLLEASAENKEAFLKWLSSVKAGGSTAPRAAVKMAMYLNPDQIYFLSDGEIVEVYRYRMMQLTPGEWKLNRYSFGQGSERFMRVFAEKHEGKYTYIP